jgi:hypothetical protein
VSNTLEYREDTYNIKIKEKITAFFGYNEAYKLLLKSRAILRHHTGDLMSS